MATGAYKRLLGLLEAQRRDAVSEAGFSLGKQAVEEEQDLKEIQSELQKEIRRVEKAQRKRGRKKGIGGLLGSALGFALAGPLGLQSASLATGLGSLAGSRLAGQKKIRGIDPNLTLRENAEFFKQQGDDMNALVDDISSQLEESYKNEILSDLVTAAASGATGGRLAKTDFGKNLSSFFDDKLFPNTRLNLGEKISNLGERTGQRFGNLFGGRGFVTDEQTAGGIFAGEVEKAARDMSIGLDSSLLFDRPGMLADEALADRFALQGPATDAFMSQGTDTSLYQNAIKNINQADASALASRDKLMSLMIDASGGLPNVDSLISQQVPSVFTDFAVEPALPKPGVPMSSAFGGSPSLDAPLSELREFAMSSVPAGSDDALFFSGTGVGDMALEDLPIEKIRNEFNTDVIYGQRNPFSRALPSYTRYTGTEAATIDALRDSLYGLDDAPYFDAFPKPQFNEQEFRRLVNAPQGDLSRLLEFYNMQRPL